MSCYKIVYYFAILACLDLISANNAIKDLDATLEHRDATLEDRDATLEDGSPLSRNRRQVAKNFAQDFPPQPLLNLEELTSSAKELSRNTRNADLHPQQRFFLGPLSKVLGSLSKLFLGPIARPIRWVVDKFFRVLAKILHFLIPDSVLKKIIPRELWSFLGKTRKHVSSESSESQEDYVPNRYYKSPNRYNHRRLTRFEVDD